MNAESHFSHEIRKYQKEERHNNMTFFFGFTL